MYIFFRQASLVPILDEQRKECAIYLTMIFNLETAVSAAPSRTMGSRQGHFSKVILCRMGVPFCIQIRKYLSDNHEVRFFMVENSIFMAVTMTVVFHALY